MIAHYKAVNKSIITNYY